MLVQHLQTGLLQGLPGGVVVMLTQCAAPEVTPARHLACQLQAQETGQQQGLPGGPMGSLPHSLSPLENVKQRLLHLDGNQFDEQLCRRY